KKPLTVNLKNAETLSPLGAQKITVYRLDEEGKRKWHTSSETDADGVVLFDLDGFDSGERYVLGAKVYNEFGVYTEAITAPGTMDMMVGSTRINVLNGTLSNTEGGNPPLANHKVYIYELVGEDKEYFGAVYTDEQGLAKIDLPGIDDGQNYNLASKSPVSQQKKYSQPLTSSGDHQFVVGNKPLNVTLVDGVSLAPLATQRIDVYRLDGKGDKHWYARSETDASGKVSFDLEGLGSGTSYLLRAEVFNDKSSYTKPINHDNDYTFKVGTTVVDVTNGTVTPAQPLVGHKVYIYELLPDGQKTYFAKVYSDTNGFIRIDLPDLNSGKTYLARAKSPTDDSTYYDKVVPVEGVTELVVGSTPLTVKLQDAINGQSIADKKITVYEILANGDKDWYTRKTTDANGIAVFDLPGLGDDGRQFKLSVYAFDDYKSYSDVLTTAGEFTFNVGSVAVHLKNGAVTAQPALANNPLTVMRIEGDKNVWVGSATSDANGTVRLDLPGIGAGVVYRFKSPSVVNGSNKYSNPITAAGNMDFVVGNPGVQVTLSNILTGAVYPQEKVTAYRIDAAGERHWYSRYTTDENGVASFDLDGIDAGQTYLFSASKFDSGSSYSRAVSAPGDLDFGIGAVPVTLIDKETEQVKTGVKITAYRIDNGQLDWIKSGYTDNVGQLIFDLPGLGEGQRFVFKASSPFGEGKRYYGPVID
ncbi:MAG: hypothetical protein MJK04_25745, partial [Psychrosphaera sp.]|nr:hypothetical protein [Psychrosphaera sp.]